MIDANKSIEDAFIDALKQYRETCNVDNARYMFIPVSRIKEYAVELGCSFEDAAEAIASMLAGDGLVMVTGALEQTQPKDNTMRGSHEQKAR